MFGGAYWLIVADPQKRLMTALSQSQIKALKWYALFLRRQKDVCPKRQNTLFCYGFLLLGPIYLLQWN